MNQTHTYSIEKKWDMKPWRNMEESWRNELLVQEANIKRLHIVWFQLYDILASKIMGIKELSGCQQLGRGERSENVKDRRILGQCNYSAYYDDRCMSLFV